MWRSPRAGSCSCFMHSPVWIIWLFFQTETAETRPALQSPLCWVWLLRPTTNDKPARACKHRHCTCYLGDVDVVGVMLGGRDHERDALVQLDACQRRDPHVEEDAEQHGQRDEPEHVRHHYGHTCGGQGRRLKVRCYVRERRQTRRRRRWFETCSLLSWDGWDATPANPKKSFQSSKAQALWLCTQTGSYLSLLWEAYLNWNKICCWYNRLGQRIKTLRRVQQMFCWK